MKASDEYFKGFIIYCDKNRQKQAVRDAYNFLTEAIQQIYSDVTQQFIHKKIKDDGKEITLETQVAYNRKANARLLTQVETKVNCICFIKINPIFKQIDPVRVVSEIMKQVHQEGREITRFCHRICPVERAFRAEHFRMITELDELLSIHSQDQQIKSWMLNYKCRNNTKFNYKEVLKETQKLTKKYGHFSDIYYPQWAISIEITNHLMCLSIAQQFKETNEFKLHKKIDKLQYTKEDDEELEKLLNQQQDDVEKLEEKEKLTDKKKEIFAKPLHKDVAQKKQVHEDQQVDAQEKQNKLLVEKIEVKEDQVDLF